MLVLIEKGYNGWGVESARGGEELIADGKHSSLSAHRANEHMTRPASLKTAATF
jgi:hypothetical protein